MTARDAGRPGRFGGGRRRRASLGAAALLSAAGVLASGAAPAQAYSPNPKVTAVYRDTSTCPCSGGALTDPYDSTSFARDPGGYAVKLSLKKGSSFVGKVEFHPNDEKLWVYDTKNDNDTIYVHITYTSGRTTHDLGTYTAPATAAVADHMTKDFDIPEGAGVDISVYDDARLTDYIGGARGTGGAVA
ncbi:MULTISPECIES: hypothetical protein [unclassified Streptomyces]|uniref:hypothetical protein n=1 Tax=unclassified Streptomyces TaxID=2593676 RepID=UPI000DBA42F0|nr:MULTISPECIES: hypothetical protein [unclassified Streptomyces]MYT69518.1 hypothetical protein [Streptomyces sp. SID8367]